MQVAPKLWSCKFEIINEFYTTLSAYFKQSEICCLVFGLIFSAEPSESELLSWKIFEFQQNTH